MEWEDWQKELDIRTARSSGAGGQHVNKTESKVELRWNIPNSKVLSEDERSLLLGRLAAKLNTEGDWIVTHQTSRSQADNRRLAMEKMWLALQKALAPVKPRKATKPTQASKIENAEAKKRRSAIKSLRGKLDWRHRKEE